MSGAPTAHQGASLGPRLSLRAWLSRQGRRLRAIGGPLAFAAVLTAAAAGYPPSRELAASGFDALRNAVAARPELQIQNVAVIGAERVTSEEVLDALDLEGGSRDLLTYDVTEARRRIESLGWVKKARVYLEAPQTLVVDIRERTPAALWRIDGELRLLDPFGAIIAYPESRRQWPDLPLVVGMGARGALHEGLAVRRAALAAGLPVAALTRIGGRRWDIELVGGPRILLPEAEPEAALSWVARWRAADALRMADYESLDFRAPDQPTGRLVMEIPLQTAALD